jgi:hypothetical protein
MPLGLEVRDLSATGDERQGAGELARVDVGSKMIRDAAEARRGQSDFFRLHEHVDLLTQRLDAVNDRPP